MESVSQFANFIPKCLFNSEFQAVIFLGLACVGAWVIFTWLIQVLKYLYLLTICLYTYRKYSKSPQNTSQ